MQHDHLDPMFTIRAFISASTAAFSELFPTLRSIIRGRYLGWFGGVHRLYALIPSHKYDLTRFGLDAVHHRPHQHPSRLHLWTPDSFEEKLTRCQHGLRQKDSPRRWYSNGYQDYPGGSQERQKRFQEAETIYDQSAPGDWRSTTLGYDGRRIDE